MFILLLIILSVGIVFAQVKINEIMPHNNNNLENEWIELYNNGNEAVNLENWKIGDLHSNDSLSGILNPNEYLLILGGNSSCTQNCINIATIGNGLNDNSDSVILMDSEGRILEKITWTSNFKNDGSSWALDNGVWKNGKPTPGEKNEEKKKLN